MGVGGGGDQERATRTHIYTYMCVYIYIQAGFLCPESFVCAKSPFGYDPG